MKVTLSPDGMTFTGTPFYCEQFVGGAYTRLSTLNSWGAAEGLRLLLTPIQ